MLTKEQIIEKIKQYCLLQDDSDLNDAMKLEQRILELCEVLLESDELLSKLDITQELLESVGIKVKQLNPVYRFE